MRDATIPWYRKARILAGFAFFYGVDREIADYGVDNETIQDLHARATLYNGKAEAVFRYLQILTSCVSSFSHGANDVALSVGPISTLYYYWARDSGAGSVPKSSSVTDWQLAVGAVSLVVGLWLYGYNMMRVLGNRLTYHSPTRGFAMELGAAITVLIAARNGIPVSTTNCIVGATVGVGLANGDWRGINWRLFLFTVSTWLYTVPLTGLMSGCLYALIVYAPRFNCAPTTIIVGVNSTALVNGLVYGPGTYFVQQSQC